MGKKVSELKAERARLTENPFNYIINMFQGYSESSSDKSAPDPPTTKVIQWEISKATRSKLGRVNTAKMRQSRPTNKCFWFSGYGIRN